MIPSLRHYLESNRAGPLLSTADGPLTTQKVDTSQMQQIAWKGL
jgi:hypothetical protein